MAASRSVLFQLPRFVSLRLEVHYHHASASPAGLGLQQRVLAAATSSKEVAAHGEGNAIVATSLPWSWNRTADLAAELLVGKGRAPSPAKPRRPGKPKENQNGRDKHNGVPDKKAKEGNKQGIRNNYAAASS